MLNILKSRKNNNHYLDRYIKFINHCRERITEETYLENHHIAPTSLFPEEKDNPTNIVALTAREHIIAHILLWKIFGNEAIAPVYYMLNVQNQDTNYNLRKIPSSVSIRYAAKSKVAYFESRIGKGVYKDNKGNRYFLDSSDPLIQELNLVGNNAGYVMSEESKENMRGKRVVKLFYKGSIQTKTFKLDDPEVERHLRLGWVIEKDEGWLAEERQEARQRQREAARIANQGTPFYYPSGIYYGRLDKNSPIVKELGLIHIRSEKQISQNASRLKLAVEAKLGTNIWNNGTEERFSLECPGDGWVLGRKPRNEEWEAKRLNAMNVKILGSTTWNDGIKNYRVPQGQKPEPHWVRGMTPRVKKDK